MTSKATATAAAPTAAAEETSLPVPTWHTHLAPPFGAGWTCFVAPPPRGYRSSAVKDPYDGSVTLQLDARPHAADAPLTIGWTWAGWKRRVSVQLATAFTVEVRDVIARPRYNGGTWVPRCVVTLRPVAGGEDIFNRVVLSTGTTSYVTVVAPQSPNLPVPVQYDLMVAFNVRASYQRTGNPQGTLHGRMSRVWSQFAFPTLAEGGIELPAEAVSRFDDDDLDPKELGAALADLDRNAEFESEEGE